MTDCAVILEAIASHDVKDSTSVAREDYDFTSALVEDVKGLRVGIPRDYFGEGLDPEVKAAVLAASEVLREKGAIVEEFDLSLVDYAIPAYYVIASADVYKRQVVGTPGSGFGPSGEGYFRLTAFGTYENTVEAINRIKAL